jgi:hypothetical protein
MFALDLIFDCCSDWNLIIRDRFVGKKQQTLHGTVATASQQKQCDLLMTKALVSSCVPFAFLENEYLQQACSVVRLTAPSRKQASGALLDKIAEETDSWSMEKIKNMQYPAGASDGWRKKTCQGGQGLMNFTILDNSSAFLKL